MERPKRRHRKTVHLAPDVHRELKIRAVMEGTDIETLTREAVNHYLSTFKPLQRSGRRKE